MDGEKGPEGIPGESGLSSTKVLSSQEQKFQRHREDQGTDVALGWGLWLSANIPAQGSLQVYTAACCVLSWAQCQPVAGHGSAVPSGL